MAELDYDRLIGGLESKMHGTGLNSRELSALKQLREQQRSSSYGIDSVVNRQAAANSVAAPPELDYRALKALSDLEESQAKQAEAEASRLEAQQRQQMQADLNNTGSRFYDPVSKDGSPREIQISMGDVVDGLQPYADARYADGKTFLPPPPIKDVSWTPTDYVLNDAGRQAQATLAGKIAPPEIPQQVIDAIFNRGGNVNPQTGQFDVNAPQQQKIDPFLLAAGQQNIRNAMTPEEVGQAMNEAQTSASLSMQPQGPPPIASQMPQGFTPQAPIVPPAFSDQQPRRVDQYQQFLANAQRRFPNMTEAQIRTAYFNAGGE